MAKLLEQLTREGAIGLVDAPAATLTNEELVLADKVMEGVKRGDHNSIAEFRKRMGCEFGESIHTTGDKFVFAFAQITAATVVDLWQAADRTWTEAIKTEEYSSFKAPKKYGISPIADGFSRPVEEPGKPGHIVPKVPEGSPYPSFTFKGEFAAAGAIHKAGGEYGLSFEEIVNDPGELVPMIPKLINESLLEREEFDAWSGLISNEVWTSANHLVGGTTVDGSTVVTDSPLTRAAVIAALEQVAIRDIRDGRKPQVKAWRVVVARGAGIRANYEINQLQPRGFDDVQGLRTLRYTSTYNPLTQIAGITETDYLTGSQWMVIPDKNAISGPLDFYEYGRLRGNVGPELRVENATGTYLGGGEISPFQGSFKTDQASFRGRVIGGPLLWNAAYAIVSDGDGQ